MKASQILSTAVLAAVSLAQTPPGFTPSVEEKLEVIFGTKAVSEPGLSLTRQETSRQPTIGTATPLNGTAYLWMLIDLDASTNFANPGAGQPATYLHTVIRDFAPSTSPNAGGVYVLQSSQTGPVAWFPPMPPAQNPPHPHRYTNLLWEQPGGRGWAIPQRAGNMLQMQKLGFDVAAFQTAAELEDPVAAVWFNVTG
ncbi:hypothetical protein DL764_009052 [Monosporascus ibericus]|uniref:PEBP-like protein n=1 Tax=Monosporascus ibericus TaxID=155417 RepID=A0A4Q4SVY9_9PEZI|nr:hypothetical protein DL764_009052 [Monosporascus ibericus]